MILENRVAFVTGAGSGIGRAGAQILAREGAFVVVSDLCEERARETVALIRDAGGSADAVALDVTDDAALGGAVARKLLPSAGNSIFSIPMRASRSRAISRKWTPTVWTCPGV